MDRLLLYYFILWEENRVMKGGSESGVP
ncbi:hypothetical protein CPT_Mater55 [Bacillus phage Mater]|uniref:Uncharacterized protein n=1 Tax=Bacillus phage Mater TaxID=1540090 RepID=A0A0A0RML8_9CAUD|nr:hypothetical protein CPT_Mater55 [Bacillus phage Mater]AIW03212.1 hypothetical protein CPT_Mater55 [Bacillus phage Mater]